MKCIQCGTDNTLQERTSCQGRCKKCNHQFAFEPKATGYPRISEPRGTGYPGLTDVLFAKALNELSANNTLYFTSKQLFYFLEKRLHKKAIIMKIRDPIMFVCGGLLIAIGTYLASGWILGIGLVLLLAGWVQFDLGSKRPRKLLISQNGVDLWVHRWNQVNSPSEKLLSSPHNRSNSMVQTTSPSEDVTAYSFDRLVVCDSVQIAQMLIANNFHFENNCAVLSISGYPEQVFSTVMQMLRRNPNLRVFAFHNCSPSGIETLHQLRTNPTWFAENNAVIIDVGLLPRQIMAAKKNMTIQNSQQSAQNLAPQIRQTLSKAELQWLDAGNWVDLESFTPKALIQILQRSIARNQNINETDSSLLRIEDEVGRYGSIYMVDSFG